MRQTGKEISEFCIKCLKQKNESEYKFCNAIKITQASFSRLKNGLSEAPRLNTVIKMAAYFNMSLSEFIGEDIKENVYDADVKIMADMIASLQETEKKAVYAVIKMYYDEELGKKVTEDSSAG